MKMFIIILSMYSCLSFAEELQVTYQVRHFTLTYTSTEVKLLGKGMDLSLKKRPCSETIFKNFREALTDVGKTQKIPSNKETVSYVLKGKSFFVDPETKLGSFLVLLPEEMKRMKIEEMIRCTN